MNLKLVELMELFPEMIRCSIIVAWGVATFFLLASSLAKAAERSGTPSRKLELANHSPLSNFRARFGYRKTSSSQSNTRD